MRALISETPGGPETLTLGELPDPTPGEGQIVVRVAACALNFPDTLMIEDKYQFRPPRPFAPGAEVSGTVAAVGAGVSGVEPGMRVIGVTGHGGLAEMALMAAADAVPLPDDCDATEGAALLFTYGTTIHALRDRASLQPGESLLVLGAAGGIGLSAVEVGKAMGARVVAAVSSAQKAEAARAAGADEALIYERAPFDKDTSKALAGAFKAALGTDGANVIYDPVGGDYAEPALRSIAWEGRYLVVGFTAGIPKLPLNLTLLKGCDVCGVFWGAFRTRDPERNRANIATLIDWWRAGNIRPRISEVLPLEQGGDAIARLGSRRAVGKVVVRVAGD